MEEEKMCCFEKKICNDKCVAYLKTTIGGLVEKERVHCLRLGKLIKG